jgi:hypothetical protein
MSMSRRAVDYGHIIDPADLIAAIGRSIAGGLEARMASEGRVA